MKNWLKKHAASSFRASNNTCYSPPWDTAQTSIYKALSPYQKGSSRLPEKALKLPDDDNFTQQEILHTTHFQLSHAINTYSDIKIDSSKINLILQLLLSTLYAPEQLSIYPLYKILKEGNPLEYIDDLLEELVSQPHIPSEELYSLTYWLATESPDRNVVKFAIVVLGSFSELKHTKLFLTLGLHDEFTLFSSVALDNTLHNKKKREKKLFSLAKRVHGWGRIALVERLSHTPSKTVQSWLLTEGYKNSVMYEYTAFYCATGGNLLKALKSRTVTVTLLRSSGELLEALFNGGCGNDIYNYNDAPQSCLFYLKQLSKCRSYPLHSFIVINQIHSFVANDTQDWNDLQLSGWSFKLREEILVKSSELLAQSHWLPLTLNGLNESDNTSFHLAAKVYQLLNNDPWEHYFKHQKTHKNNNWLYLMDTDNSERLQRVILLAQEQFLEGEFTALTEEYNSLIFERILLKIQMLPGVGNEFLLTALNSHLSKIQLLAFNILENWKSKYWPENTVEILKILSNKENECVIRSRALALLT